MNMRGGFRADALGGGRGGAPGGIALDGGPGNLTRTVRRIFQQGFGEGAVFARRTGGPRDGGPGDADGGIGRAREYARRQLGAPLRTLRGPTDRMVEAPPQARVAQAFSAQGSVAAATVSVFRQACLTAARLAQRCRWVHRRWCAYVWTSG